MQMDVDRDALLDELIQSIEDTPQKRIEYMCHGEPHSSYVIDLTSIRTRFDEIFSSHESGIEQIKEEG